MLKKITPREGLVVTGYVFTKNTEGSVPGIAASPVEESKQFDKWGELIGYRNWIERKAFFVFDDTEFFRSKWVVDAVDTEGDDVTLLQEGPSPQYVSFHASLSEFEAALNKNRKMVSFDPADRRRYTSDDDDSW